jgi:hypothetical protein
MEIFRGKASRKISMQGSLSPEDAGGGMQGRKFVLGCSWLLGCRGRVGKLRVKRGGCRHSIRLPLGRLWSGKASLFFSAMRYKASPRGKP